MLKPVSMMLLILLTSASSLVWTTNAKTALATASLVSGWFRQTNPSIYNGLPSTLARCSLPSIVLASEKSPDLSDFTKMESGLQFRDVIRGEGSIPKSGQSVRVNYVGWLDGFEGKKKFDSSYERNSPLVFKVGTHQVISGWDEALLTDMPVGTKRNIIVPAELGYGSRGAGGVIPPNADLYFTMELVGLGVR